MSARRSVELQAAAQAYPSIGREVESQVLRDCLTRARSGAGALVLLSGEAGVGKTRLYREVLLSDIGTDVVGFIGHGDPESSEVQLAPLVDGLRVVRKAAGGRIWRSLVERTPWLSRIRPELLPGSPWPDPPGDRHALFESLLDGLREAAGRSALIWALDDMHWADPTSWTFVRHASRRIGLLPIVLVIAYRPREVVAQEGLAVLAQLAHAPHVVELPLHRLDAPETERLVRSLLPAEHAADTVATIVQQSDGNPAIAADLARAGAAEVVPPFVRAYAKARMETLSPGARDLLDRLATIGRRAHLDLLSSIVPALSQEALQELVEGGLASLEQGTWVRLDYPLFAEAVYEQMAWSRRRSVHEAIADALGRGSARRRADVRDLARHRELGGDPREAFHDLVSAAAVARGEGRAGTAGSLYLAAHELAVRHYELAEARESMSGHMLDDLAGAGRWVEVLPLARELWDDRAHLSLKQRATLAVVLGLAAVMTGTFKEGWNPLRPEVAQVAAATRARAAAPASGVSAGDLMNSARAFARRLHDLANLGDEPGVQRLASCLDHVCAFYRHRDRDQSALSYLLEAQLAGEGQAAIQAFALWNRARMTGQVEHAYEAEAIGDHTGSWVGGLSRMLLGTLHLLEGRTRQAAEAFEQSTVELRLTAPLLEPVLTGLQANVLIQRGELEAAHQLLRRWDGSDFPGRPVWGVVSGAAGWLAWEEADLEAATDHLRTCASECALTGYGPCESGPLLIPLQVDALLRLDRRDEASQVLRDAVDLHRCPDRFFLAAIALANFRLCPSAAAAADARRQTASAPWPYMEALAARWQGELLGRPTDGYRRRATGLVSQRELEIAVLIAQGLTNQAIAYRLYLSPHTVGTHIKNLLSKLQFNSRAQIAAWSRDQSNLVDTASDERLT